jgi:hypothetical protein
MGKRAAGSRSDPAAVARLEEAYRYCENAELLAIRPWIATDLARARWLAGRWRDAPRLLGDAIEESGVARTPVPALAPSRLSERGAARGRPRRGGRGVGHTGGGPRRRAWRERLSRGGAPRSRPGGVAAKLAGSRGGRGASRRRPRPRRGSADAAGRRPLATAIWPRLARRAGRSAAAAVHLEAARELYRELDLPYWRERLSGDGMAVTPRAVA